MTGAIPLQIFRIHLVLIALLGLLAVPASGAEELNLSLYEGKVVVVDFWASWCVPCRRSFPWMNEMLRKYGDDGLVIVGINVDADASEASQFLAETPAEFRIIYDPEGELARQYDVMAMPSSYLFDRSGRQVARHLGFKVKQQDEYEALLVETLNR